MERSADWVPVEGWDRSKGWDGTGRDARKRAFESRPRRRANRSGSRRPQEATAKRMEKASEVSKVVGEADRSDRRSAEAMGRQSKRDGMLDGMLELSKVGRDVVQTDRKTRTAQAKVRRASREASAVLKGVGESVVEAAYGRVYGRISETGRVGTGERVDTRVLAGRANRSKELVSLKQSIGERVEECRRSSKQ